MDGTNVWRGVALLWCGLALGTAACAPEGPGHAAVDFTPGDEPDAGPEDDGSGPALLCPGAFTWLDITAISAEREPFPSLLAPSDTRAGSVDAHLNGGYGFGANETDAAFASGFLTLRDGAGNLLEELQLNRRYRPASLAEDGCTTSGGAPQCWLPPESGPPEGVLVAGVPHRVRDSNAGFDDSGQRVTVAALLRIDLSGDPPRDNAHETIRVTWNAPRGIETARILLRGSYRRAPLDSGIQPESFTVPLLRGGWSDEIGAGRIAVTVVREVERTDQRLTVEISAQPLLEYLCGYTLGCAAKGTPALTIREKEAVWPLTNGGDDDLAFDSLHIAWPASNGRLEEVRLGNHILVALPVETSPLFAYAAQLDAPLVLEAGEQVDMVLRFSETASADSRDYYARLDALSGCVVELAGLSCRTGPHNCGQTDVPLGLRLRYTGQQCLDSLYAQDPADVTCDGDPKFATPVRVLVTEGGVEDEAATTWFEGEVALDGAFTVDPALVGAAELPAVTRVRIYRPEGELLQDVSFATGCNVPLLVGDRFGAVLLDACGDPADLAE